jgi:hypothetical protein
MVSDHIVLFGDNKEIIEWNQLKIMIQIVSSLSVLISVVFLWWHAHHG